MKILYFQLKRAILHKTLFYAKNYEDDFVPSVLNIVRFKNVTVKSKHFSYKIYK